ncbi:MAG: DUF3800 domain-containing protein [Deltaproteobacteria bacterium]|nr:DUF3800 domain-containing protein [Nannocystaceae bacterium]
MVDVMTLYMDDSGSRLPDHTPSEARQGPDWFGYGGFMVRDDDRAAVEAAHDRFRDKWNIREPLHSSEIRFRCKGFAWLKLLDQASHERFMDDLTALMTMNELTVIGAVVDRPGYNARYQVAYGEQRWSLCRTAFSIVVERAMKFARRCGCRLRVYVENTDPATDKKVRGYYNELKDNGLPFSRTNSEKYRPLTLDDIQQTLYEFDFKRKSSRLMQLADLCLWPICRGAYDPGNRPYKALSDAGTLINCRLDPADIEMLGIKRSCFELHDTQAQAGPDDSALVQPERQK